MIVTTTIADGGATSPAVALARLDCGRPRLVGIQFPASMTSTEMTFQGSVDGVTYAPIKDIGSGTSYSITVTSSACVPVKRDVFLPWPYIKCVGGSNESGAKVLSLSAELPN